MEAKFIHFKGKVITVSQNLDGYWQDDKGTLYAYSDPTWSVDNYPACGIGIFTLPTWPCFVELNKDCSYHDARYETPIYQAWHTREEADAALEENLSQSGYPILGRVFSWIASVFGKSLWENEKTR